MQFKSPPTIAELEQILKDATAVFADCLAKHGDSHELTIMRSAIFHIEEKINELRAALQDGMQDMNKEVCMLNKSTQISMEKIESDVENFNSGVLEDITKIEQDFKELRATTED